MHITYTLHNIKFFFIVCLINTMQPQNVLFKIFKLSEKQPVMRELTWIKALP